MDLEDAYDRFGGAVYRHVLSITRHSADAEDVVHTVFAKLARRTSWWIPVKDVEAYLHVAARREAFRILGRSAHSSLDEAAESEVDPASSKDAGSTDSERLAAAIERLPADQCEVFRLHAVEGETFARIGELIGVSSNTAASRYRYAREKLREWLDE